MDKLDKWIEAVFKKSLHASRPFIINKMIAKFEKKHPQLCSDSLSEKFENEADRIYPMVDRSILRDRILRAKWTFWATAIVSILVIGSQGGFTSKSVLPFITPAVSAIITWIVSVSTISISYNQRIKGGMDSVAAIYEKTLVVQPVVTDSSTYITRALTDHSPDVVIAIPEQYWVNDDESLASFDSLDDDYVVGRVLPLTPGLQS